MRAAASHFSVFHLLVQIITTPVRNSFHENPGFLEPVRQLSRKKCLLPTLTTVVNSVQSLEPTWWKVRANSGKVVL